MTRLACALALLLLAGCGNDGGIALPVDRAATAPERAVQGCASGEPAGFLHQNRPGGTDFDATRCSADGY